MNKWTYKGKTYRAKRDSKGYIYISEFKEITDMYLQGKKKVEVWYPLGHAGYDFCFRFEDVPELASKLGISI